MCQCIPASASSTGGTPDSVQWQRRGYRSFSHITNFNRFMTGRGVVAVIASYLLAQTGCHPHTGAGSVAHVPPSLRHEDLTLLTTPGPASEYVEGYQRALRGGLPPDTTAEPPVFQFMRVNDSFIFALCEEVLATGVQYADQPLPTRFTNFDLLIKTRILLPYILDSTDDLRNTMPHCRILRVSSPAPMVATLPLPSIQAVAVPCPVGESPYFIAMSEGSSRWIHRLARLSLRLVTVMKGGDVPIADASPETYQKRIEQLPGLHASTASSILTIASGDPQYGRYNYLPGDNGDSAACELTMAMHLFVLSHEYAHTLLGHLRSALPSRPRHRTAIADIRGTRLAALAEPYAESWQDELEADYAGSLLFFFAMDRMAKDRVILRPTRYRTWSLGPAIFVTFSTVAESVHARAADYFDPHVCGQEGTALSREYANKVIERLRQGRPRINGAPPLLQPYPPRVARLRAVALAFKNYLVQLRTAGTTLTAEEMINLRRATELERRVHDLLHDIVVPVNQGIPELRSYFLSKENTK